MMRQFLFDSFHLLQFTELKSSSNQSIKEIAEKAIKEVSYHLERSTETVIALGDSTEEGHSRMQNALDRLWPYVGEAFHMTTWTKRSLRLAWDHCPATLNEYDNTVAAVRQAMLNIPTSDFAHKGGKSGAMHSEHLGHLLAQMQYYNGPIQTRGGNVDQSTTHIWQFLDQVPDPEIPAISIVDLGIVRDVSWKDGASCHNHANLLRMPCNL